MEPCAERARVQKDFVPWASTASPRGTMRNVYLRVLKGALHPRRRMYCSRSCNPECLDSTSETKEGRLAEKRKHVSPHPVAEKG